MESMHAEQNKKTKTREGKKPKRAEGVECGGKQIKKQKQRQKKGMEKENLINEGNEEIEIEDDDVHLGIYRHCADYLLSQTDTQTCALFVGPDGEVRIPMVSQYGDTPSASGTLVQDDFELGFVQVRSNLLDNLFREFEICVNKMNNTITESCLMFPESDLLKQKALEWKEIMKMHLVVDDEKKKDGDEVEKGDQNVDAEKDDVAEAAEPVDPQKGSVSLDGYNSPTNERNKDHITQHTSP
ncbi:hypothetical protein HanXRQr2_Chr14g0649301 [Helianthus annuus]|uniref:Uncharacterized protein n=1 Tax=Helianthus annuus TaxID=4232 RepID=A0A9K3H8X2_HELAN|nr:hypothetical protein HanXRQr2_Chr14g0649301 [Helianthus annuus]